MEWVRRLQWKDTAAVTQMNSFTVGKCPGRKSDARSFDEPREPLMQQVPRADPAGLFTPALVDICPGVSSLWRRLRLTFKFIFHVNSLLIPPMAVVDILTSKQRKVRAVICGFWRGTECPVWAPLSGVPAESHRAGAGSPRKCEVAEEDLGAPGRWWPELGPLCFQTTSVSLWDRDQQGEGQFGAYEAPEGPCGAWATGTWRSEARCPCRCQAPTRQLQIHVPADSQGTP